jgi:hypothetical protein
MEGIDAIAHLLSKVQNLQQKNDYLKRRLLILGDEEDII